MGKKKENDQPFLGKWLFCPGKWVSKMVMLPPGMTFPEGKCYCLTIALANLLFALETFALWCLEMGLLSGQICCPTLAPGNNGVSSRHVCCPTIPLGNNGVSPSFVEFINISPLKVDFIIIFISNNK